MKKKSGEMIVEKLYQEWFNRYGFTDVIHGDNEKAFVEGIVKRMCEEHGVVFRSCAAYDHRQNGQAERLQHFIVEQLKMVTDSSANSTKDWTKFIGIIKARNNMIIGLYSEKRRTSLYLHIG